MRIIKYFHSCFLVEEGEGRILFDPGIFSFIERRIDPNVFKDIQAIFITHSHPDHVDIVALKKILANNSGALTFTNTDVQEFLNKESIACTIFEEGEKRVGGFRVRAIPADHQPLLAPVPQNTAFLVNDTFLTTGDSINQSLYSLAGTKVLALPILAPWGNVLQVAEFFKAMKAEVAIPAHDGSVLDSTLDRQHTNWMNYANDNSLSFYPLVGPEKSLEVQV